MTIGISIFHQGAYQGLRSRGSAHLVEGLVSLHEIENKSVDQLLNGTFEGVREGVAYPEAGAEMEATPSPFIQAYRTSVIKALKQPDGPRKGCRHQGDTGRGTTDHRRRGDCTGAFRFIERGGAEKGHPFSPIRNPEIRCTG